MRSPLSTRRPAMLGAVVVALGALFAHGGIPVEADMAFGLRQASGEWRAASVSGRPGTLQHLVDWRSVAEGVDVAEAGVGRPGGWQADLVLARIDPSKVDLGLERATRRGGLRGDWTVDSPGAGAVLSVNAGQFEGGRPWGWLVMDGRELQPPGTGSLTMALVIDREGAARLVPLREVPRLRHAPEVRWAFQSYPVLVDAGEVPSALLGAGRGVDLEHRDIRLAVGTLPDGHLLVALTRYGSLAGRSLPYGPTVPEMAGLMRGLGVENAVMLDGGLSAQLAYQGSNDANAWRAGRRVPLGLVARTAAR